VGSSSPDNAERSSEAATEVRRIPRQGSFPCPTSVHTVTGPVSVKSAREAGRWNRGVLSRRKPVTRRLGNAPTATAAAPVGGVGEKGNAKTTGRERTLLSVSTQTTTGPVYWSRPVYRAAPGHRRPRPVRPLNQPHPKVDAVGSRPRSPSATRSGRAQRWTRPRLKSRSRKVRPARQRSRSSVPAGDGVAPRSCRVAGNG
jgi:hypothetical protein